MKARSNPFRSDRVERFRYQLSPEDWQEIENTFQGTAYRAAIVGPHGTGKTVFMEDFAVRLQSQGWAPRTLRFRDAFTRQDRQLMRKFLLETHPTQSLLLLDGGELLPARDWKWLLRKLPPGHALLATLHQENQLPTLWRTRPQVEIARQVIEFLLERPLLPAEEERVEKRFHEFAGNIRNIVRSFYLEYAELKTPASGGSPQE